MKNRQSESTQRRNINFVYWNVKGLKIETKNSKLNKPDFIQVINQQDFIFLAETQPGEYVYIKGYRSKTVNTPFRKI